jgi:polysaccharide export outer membrane protein
VKYESEADFDRQENSRGKFMSRAMLALLIAVLPILACAPMRGAQQEPPKPIVQGTPDQVKPPTGTPPADIDPAKLAAPRDPEIVKAASRLPINDAPYILGAEDQIQITVLNGVEFSGSHLIRPDGKITINLVGEVKASGNTPEELGNTIKERVKKYIVEPDVSVQVLAVRSRKFYIQGEVNKPGEYLLVTPIHVLEALVNAGGFRDFANQRKIVIMAPSGERKNFNYKDVIRGRHMEQNILLNPGDIILVH